MVLFEGTLGLGIGLLIAVALGQYAKVKSTKGWQVMAAAAVLFLFSAVWTAPAVGVYLAPIGLLKEAVELLGWLLTLIAALFIAYEALLEVF